MRLLALLLALLAPWPALAGCRAHACSDDVDGVLGNEELSWDPSPGATYYEVGVMQDTDVGLYPTACAKVINSTSYLVSGTPCDEQNTGDGFVVRACNDAGCSAWSSDSVEILPHACLEACDWDPCLTIDHEGNCIGGHRTQCEKPCYEWQPDADWRRLPERYDECV